MPRFDVPCNEVWQPKCDCELACLLVKPPLSAADMVKCRAKCAHDTPVCNACASVVEGRAACLTGCVSNAAHAVSECLEGVEDHNSLAAFDCTQKGPAAYTACAVGCATVYAAQRDACQKEEAKCRAGACESDLKSYSQDIARCESLYSKSYSAAFARSIIQVGGCKFDYNGCEATCGRTAGAAIAACDDLPPEDRAACVDAATAASTLCGFRCEDELTICSSNTSAAYARLLAPIRGALLICRAQAEAAQRARDDRTLDPSMSSGVRLKRAIGDRNEVLCVAEGADGSGGQARFLADNDQAEAQFQRCTAQCRVGQPSTDDFNACFAGCVQDQKDTVKELQRSLITSLYDCFKQRIGSRDTFADCELACALKASDCAVAQAEGVDCSAAQALCLNKCRTASEKDYQVALAGGLQPSARSCPSFTEWASPYYAHVTLTPPWQEGLSVDEF